MSDSDIIQKVKNLSNAGPIYLHLTLEFDDPFSTWNLRLVVDERFRPYESMTKEELRNLWLFPSLGVPYNGVVAKANKEAFWKEFGHLPGVQETPAGETAVRVSGITPEMEVWFAALADYPVVDEDLYYQKEAETKKEAWDSWVRQEFESALEEHIGEVYEADVSLDLEDEELYKLFLSKISSESEWIEQSDGSLYLDSKFISEAAKAIGPIEFVAAGGSIEFC